MNPPVLQQSTSKGGSIRSHNEMSPVISKSPNIPVSSTNSASPSYQKDKSPETPKAPLKKPLVKTKPSLTGASPRKSQVTVIIGNPIHFDDILGTEEAGNVSRKHLYDAVSSRIGKRLLELKAQVDRVSLEQQSIMSQNAKTCSDRAADIFHRVDWDSFGMGAYFSEESPVTISKEISQTDDCVVVSNSLDRRSPKGEEGSV